MINRPLHIPGRRFVLTKKMVENAIENTKSNAEASRWLGVSYNTYKKYAKMYNLFEGHKNQSGVGVKKGWATYKISLEDIFSGKIESKYSLGMFKKRLIEEGYFQEECSNCNYNEANLLTEKVCLTVDFVDGDNKNNKYENLRLLCPNCYLSFNGSFTSSKTFCK